MRFLRYRVADPGGVRVALNTYPGRGSRRKVIGAYVVLGQHCYSLTWRRP